MKIIGILNGVAALRESVEEYQPKTPPPIQDIIAAIRTAYQFAQFPMLPPGGAIPTSFVFSGGRFVHGDNVFAIGQLVMMQDGDIVAAGNTDHADLVLAHLIDLMEREFSYRLKSSNMQKRYLSSLVAEFDAPVEHYLEKLQEIERIIDTHRTAGRGNFKLKRLNFGDSPETFIQTPDPLSNIEAADFLIERRTGHKFEENRYFCSAPMSTSDHISTLETIERVIRAN